MKAGDRAEQIAAGYLRRKGLALIETHYRCRWGEIDLILRDLDTVVFTEVKLRRSKGFGGAPYRADRPRDGNHGEMPARQRQDPRVWERRLGRRRPAFFR